MSAQNFYEINSTLREDTSIRKGLPAATVLASEPDDEDIDINEQDGTAAWLDDEGLGDSEYCGTAAIFDIEAYVNFESAILCDLLACDSPEETTRKNDSELRMDDDSERDGNGAKEVGDSAEVTWSFSCEV